MFSGSLISRRITGKRRQVKRLYVLYSHSSLDPPCLQERARDLFYALWIPDLFMKRVESNSVWSLFCPDECPGLVDSHGPAFDELYARRASTFIFLAPRLRSSHIHRHDSSQIHSPVTYFPRPPHRANTSPHTPGTKMRGARVVWSQLNSCGSGFLNRRSALPIQRSAQSFTRFNHGRWNLAPLTCCIKTRPMLSRTSGTWAPYAPPTCAQRSLSTLRQTRTPPHTAPPLTHTQHTHRRRRVFPDQIRVDNDTDPRMSLVLRLPYRSLCATSLRSPFRASSDRKPPLFQPRGSATQICPTLSCRAMGFMRLILRAVQNPSMLMRSLIWMRCGRSHRWWRVRSTMSYRSPRTPCGRREPGPFRTNKCSSV